MTWLLDHLQVAVLVLLGVGSLFKTVMESAAKARRETSAPPPARGFSQDKSYRKRAPSVPPPLARSAVPPPALPRDNVAPADRLAGYEMEAANEQAKVLKHQADLADRLNLIRENRAQLTGGAAVTRSAVATQRAAKPFLATTYSLRSRLRDPAEIRRAFVMREILDPPVGLR